MNHEELVEAVARVIAPHMEGGREYDQMPPDRLALRKWSREGMCSVNDATQADAVEAAQAALSAAEPLIRADERKRVEGEIVAWLRAGFDEYPHGKYGRCSELQNYWTHAATAIEAGDYRKGAAILEQQAALRARE